MTIENIKLFKFFAGKIIALAAVICAAFLCYSKIKEWWFFLIVAAAVF